MFQPQDGVLFPMRNQLFGVYATCVKDATGMGHGAGCRGSSFA